MKGCDIRKMASNRRATLTTGKSSASATWLKNAMKSVGLATKLEFSKMAPNLSETSSAVMSGASSLASVVSRRGDNASIVSNIKNNKYVKFANNTINQAIKDIKSGKFVKEDFDESDSTEYSLGDDGSETIEIKNDNTAIKQLSESVDRQTEANLKAQKATMDAYIAVNTVNLQQNNKLGADIINQLNSINTNLASIVQFNNDNMQKFVEASISYYNQMGAKLGKSEDNIIEDRKIEASDLIGRNRGGINLNTYKSYIKQQFKKTLNNTELGQLGAVFNDDTFLEQIEKNPLGMASSLLTSYMIPVTLKATIEGVEKTFSNFMPTMLAKLGDWGNIQGSDIASKLMNFVGNTFGIRKNIGDNINNHKIERGPIPFDGETKTAITEVITKELRDQTAYLEIIANHYAKGNNARKQAAGLKTYYDYSDGQYKTSKEIDNNISDMLVSSIRSVFEDSSFGKNLKANTVSNRRDDKDKKIMQAALDELMINISRQSGSLDMKTLEELIMGTKQSKDVKKNLLQGIKDMKEKDALAFAGLNNLGILSNSAYKEAKNRLREDNLAYGVNNSSFNGSKTTVDEYGNTVERSTEDILDEVLGINNYKEKNKHGKILKSGRKGTTGKGYVTVEGMGLANLGERSSKIMNALIAGDSLKVISEGGKMLAEAFAPIGEKAAHFLFGDKDGDGNRSGGLLSDLSNFGSDVFKQMKYKLLGTGYTLSDGTKVEDDPNSLSAQFKNSMTLLKDKLSKSIFGEKDSEGNKIEEGLLGKVKTTFMNGFSFWTDAFFGVDDIDDPKEREKARKEHMDQTLKNIKENLPNAGLGALGGLAFSQMAGGLLGTIVGSPMIAASLGATAGFLAKNEKFQNYLFGEVDPDTNERKGGLISKGVQDWFKDNKDAAALGIGAGTILGTMGFLPPGSGMLVNLVGGPVAGSLLGLAGSVAVKSGMFNKFLFGDEESGQRGLIGGINHVIEKNFGGKNGDNTAAGKLFGIGAGALIGKLALGGGLTSAGGILGAITSGPVVGSLLGLALTIKASEGGFKEWLFGSKDGLDLGDGTKTKKQGLLGRIGNTIDVNIIKPMKTTLSWVGKDFMNVLEHKILMPFAITTEFVTDKVTSIMNKATSGVKGFFGKALESGKKGITKLFSPVTKAVGNIMTKSTEMLYKTTRRIISAPGDIMMAVIKGLDLKEKFKEFLPVKLVRGFLKDTRKLIFAGIKGVFKGIFKVITSPFKAVGFLGKWFGRGIKAAATSIFGAVKNSKLFGKAKNALGGVGSAIGGAFNKVKTAYGEIQDGKELSIAQLIKRNSKEYKENKKNINEQRKANKAHDKNAKLIAKASKGQFREDSEEARKWLLYHKPDVLAKVESNSEFSIDEEYNRKKKENDAKINGEGTKGLSNAQLDRKNPSDLTEQGRTNWFLSRIMGFIEKITGKVVNGSNDRYISPEEQDVLDALKAEEVGDVEGENDEGESSNGKFTHLTKYDKKLGLFGNFKKMMKTYYDADVKKKEEKEKDEEKARKDFLDSLDTPGNIKAIGTSFKNAGGKTKKIMKALFGSNNSDELSDEAEDAGIPQHGVGGFLKNGLALVGEKGAELIKKTKDSVKVFTHDESSKLLKSGKAKEMAEEARKETTLDKARTHSEENRKEALDRAVTANERREQIKKEKEAEEEKKEKKAWMSSIKEGVKNTASNVGGLFSNFLNVFGLKKGILTVGIIAGLSWIKNKFPNLFKTVENIAKGIGEFVSSFAGSVLKDLMTKTFDDKNRTDNNSITEEAERIIDETKDGNILQFNEDGNISNRTHAVTNALKNKAIRWKFRNEKGLLDPIVQGKWGKREKKLYRGIDKVGNFFTQDSFTRKSGVIDESYLKDRNVMLKNKGNSYFLTEADALANPDIVDELSEMGYDVETVKDGSRMSRFTDKVKDIGSKGKSKIDDMFSTASTKLKNTSVGKKASDAIGTVKKAGTKVKDLALETMNKATTGDGLIGKLMKYVDDFFNFLADGAKKKFGKKAGKGLFSKFGPKAIKSGLQKVWSSGVEKLAKTTLGKIVATVSGKVALAATTLGIGNLISLGAGAIEGYTATAKLFGVSSDDVDGTMKIISTIFGALEGTTIGGIASILSEFIYSVLDINLLRSAATAIYNVVSSEEDEKKLSQAQDSWHTKYQEETDKSLKEQYETQKKLGIIPKDITYDEFMVGVEEGKYSVNHMSESDWNADKNKSLGDKIMGGLGSAWGATKKFFAGEKQYTDSNGNVYTEGKNGMWNVVDKNGNEVGQVGKDAIPEDAVESKKHGIVSGTISKVGGVIGGAAKKVGGFIGGAAKKVGGALLDNIKNVGGSIIDGASGAWNSLKKGNVVGAVASVGKAAYNVLTSPYKTTFKFLTTKTTKGYFKDDGSYYVINGEKYDHYSANGDLIEEGCDPDPITQLISSGALTEGDVTVKNAAGKFVDNVKEKVSNLWKSAKEKGGQLLDKVTNGKFSEFADKVKEAGGIGGFVKGLFTTTGKEGWFDQTGSYYIYNKSKKTFTKYNPNGDVIEENIKEEDVKQMIDSGLLTKSYVKVDGAAKKTIKNIGEKLKDVWESAKKNSGKVLDSIKNVASGAVDGIKNFFGFGGSGNGIPLPSGGGGFGTYFSQNDPKWKDSSYNTGSDNATMGEAGCGPTAMAMAISDATGKKVDPMTMANMAKMTGNRDYTGTNWNFINNASNAYGVGTTQILNPTSRDIISELKSGSPVVLSGASDSSGPYTKAGHYIVARGIDANGNVIVDDPRGKAYSKGYNLEKLADATDSSWIIGGRGKKSKTETINGKTVTTYYGKEAKKMSGNDNCTLLQRTVVGNDENGHSKYEDVMYDKNGNQIRSVSDEARTKNTTSKEVNDITKWIAVIKEVKKKMAAKKMGYSQSAYTNITIGDKTVNMRTDCSGFVSTCLKFYGVMDDKQQMTSYAFTDKNNAAMKKTGFTAVGWTGWDTLKEGDIISRDGHVEIFAYNDGGKHYVYNVGSDSSANNPNPTPSAKPDYTTVWKPSGAGESCIMADGNGAVVEGIGQNTSILDKIKNAFSAASTGLQDAMFGKDVDFNALIQQATSDGTTTTSSDDTVTDSTGNVSSIGTAASEGGKSAMKGQTITPPSGLGTANTWMGWQIISSPSSQQYKLREKAGQNFDENGYGHINGRYTVATTTTYGQVGDYLDIKRASGKTLKAIIADIKSQNDKGCNMWGHQDGKSITEFVVDKGKWYAKDSSGRMAGYQIGDSTYPANDNSAVVSVTNMGNYFTDSQHSGNGGGFGSGLSGRNRYKIGKATSNVDMRNATVNRSNLFKLIGNTHGGYGSYEYDGVYGGSDTTNELLIKAIEILSAIAGNTLDSSNKLSALDSIKNLQSNTSVNNNSIVIPGSNNSTPIVSKGPSRKDITANNIAKGGY